MSELSVGQTVQLSDGRIAVVRYVGQTEFAPGEWIGVELEGYDGKNDGSVQGERYFDCEMNRGMFLRPAAATIIAQPPPPVKTTNGPNKKPARPSSVGGPNLVRRQSGVPDPGAGKRMSMNAASPSPVTRSRPSSTIRVGPESFISCSALSNGLLIVAYEVSYQTAICHAIDYFYTTNRHPFKCAKPFCFHAETSDNRCWK